ncbi:MAG: TonB-dependent receptor [Cyclobacteriaceae bacterium]
MPSNYRKFFLLIFSLAMVHTVCAQPNCQYQVQGKVVDAVTQAPIPFASVRILDTTKGAISEESGEFLITGICDEDFVLEVTHLGYKKSTHHHDPSHEDPIIYLATDEQMLESITVEGEAATSNLETISSTELSQKDLATGRSESLGGLLSQIAGVNTISAGQNVVKPVIHGLHSNRILIVNNGVRHEFQNWGSDHAPEIDPSLIDNIEVVKGAAAVPYGPEALGGVILINPAPIELSSHLHGEIGLTGKSNGRSGESTLKLQKGFKHFGVMGEGSWIKQGDLHAPDYSLTNTGKEELSYAAGVRVHPFHFLDITAHYSHFNQELGIFRGGVNGNLDDLLLALESNVPNETKPFSYDINTPKQKISHDMVRADATYNDGHQSISVQYGYQFNHRREFDVRRGNDLEIANINLELKSQSVDLDWVHPKVGKLTGKVGLQWLTQDNQNIPGTNTIPFVPNFQTTRLGYYLIESITSGDNTFEFGLRYDTQTSDIVGRDRQNNLYRNALSFQNATATIGFQRKIKEGYTFRSNLGTAWRPPNIAELYRFGRHLTFIEYGLWRYDIDEDGQITTANVLTDEDRPVPSEQGYKWINSIEIKKANLQLEVVGYVNYIKNYIFTKPAGVTTTVRGTAPYFIYDQTDALFWGVDVSAYVPHSAKMASRINASYLSSFQLDSKDFFAGQPPANIRYDFTYRPTIRPFSTSEVTLFVGYTFRQFQAPKVITVQELIDANPGDDLFTDQSDFDILPPPDGYFLVNLTWTSNIKRFGMQFQVKNFFNTRYRNYTDRLRYFADDLGRNFVLGLSYQL